MRKVSLTVNIKKKNKKSTYLQCCGWKLLVEKKTCNRALNLFHIRSESLTCSPYSYRQIVLCRLHRFYGSTNLSWTLKSDVFVQQKRQLNLINLLMLKLSSNTQKERFISIRKKIHSICLFECNMKWTQKSFKMHDTCFWTLTEIYCVLLFLFPVLLLY